MLMLGWDDRGSSKARECEQDRDREIDRERERAGLHLWTVYTNDNNKHFIFRQKVMFTLTLVENL